jgi:hypothetical protein
VFQGLIKEHAGRGHLAIPVLQAKLADLGLGHPARHVGHPVKLGRQLGESLPDLRAKGTVGIKVVVLDHAITFKQIPVIWRRVSSHHDRRAVHSRNEHARALIVGKVGRAAHQRGAPGSQPVAGGIQQPLRSDVIVDHLKKTKPTLAGLALRGQTSLQKSGDGAHNLAAVEGKIKNHVRVPVKRPSERIEVRHLIRDQRRHPVRIILIHAPRELDKSA